MTRPRAKPLLLVLLLASLALPAIAQESLLPPGFGDEEGRPEPAASESRPATRPAEGSPQLPSPATAAEEGQVQETSALTAEELPDVPPPVELPDHARRDPFAVGVLDPVTLGLGADPWGGASGEFLSVLLRRIDTPLPSRWLHIVLRNALLADARAPRNLHPVDWVAERAWLLLRMGEADAARMLVAGVDVDVFTPKMYQVAVQSALATADPAALCPLQAGIAEVEPRVAPLAEAMCAALSGEPERAAAGIESVRRRGRVGGIDLLLAEKVVGVGGDTRRSVTVDWEPVERLTSWRFGLAAATGLAPPQRLWASSSPQVKAWQARSPLLSPEARLDSARVAAGLGVLSSTALVDLYATIYDSTDPDELGGSDAWQLRAAYAGRDVAARLAAMRHLWGVGQGELERQASRAMLALAATRIAPSAEQAAEAPDLIASMLAAGFDRQAARWAPVVRAMEGEGADRSWAMLALGAPRFAVDPARVAEFIERDSSDQRQRSGLLLAGLVGLGRIDARTAARLAAANAIQLDVPTRWTALIGGARQRRQPGTVAILAATGLQSAGFARVKPAYLMHALAALRDSGQDYAARMIAAEALART